MGKVSIKALVSKYDNQYSFKPATIADKRVIDTFAETSVGKYVTLTVNYSKGDKTYDQVKTIWALIAIMYEAINGFKPTSDQSEQLYSELLDSFAERTPSILHQGDTVPIPLSSMSKQQASSFTQCIINELAESCDLTPDLQSDVKEIFEQFQKWKGEQITDPVDYGENGVLLTTSEWLEKNVISFASGLKENLEIAHIVSKGTAPQYRDCCWNFLRLTHEEHMMQHKIGWDKFLEIYPHLKPRVEKARELAHKIDTLNKPEKIIPDEIY